MRTTLEFYKRGGVDREKNRFFLVVDVAPVAVQSTPLLV